MLNVTIERKKSKVKVKKDGKTIVSFKMKEYITKDIFLSIGTAEDILIKDISYSTGK